MSEKHSLVEKHRLRANFFRIITALLLLLLVLSLTDWFGFANSVDSDYLIQLGPSEKADNIASYIDSLEISEEEKYILNSYVAEYSVELLGYCSKL